MLACQLLCLRWYTNMCTELDSNPPPPITLPEWAQIYAAGASPRLLLERFGGNTAVETNIDMQLMIDMSALVDAGKNTFRLGLEYQYWNNKFGHSHKGAAGSGALAKTPMIRTEYHF